MPDLIAIADGLAKFGGNVVRASLSTQDEAELQDALHGTSA